MRRPFSVAVLVSALFFSCDYATDNLFYDGNSPDGRDTAISEISAPTSSAASFLVISDVHFGTPDYSLPETRFFEWLDGLEQLPAFCLCLGDVADHGYESEFEQYKDFTQKIGARGVSVLNVIGNHDLYNSGYEHWKSYCEPHTSCWKFCTGQFSWYGLDTGTGGLGTRQYQNLASALQSDPNPKIILTHYPLYSDTNLFCMEDTAERNHLIRLFAQTDVRLYLGGHLHLFERVDFGNFTAVTVPSFATDRKWMLFALDEGSGEYSFSIID